MKRNNLPQLGLVATAIFSISNSASAHPGHGLETSSNLLHLATSPSHLLAILAVASIALITVLFAVGMRTLRQAVAR